MFIFAELDILLKCPTFMVNQMANWFVRRMDDQVCISFHVSILITACMYFYLFGCCSNDQDVADARRNLGFIPRQKPSLFDFNKFFSRILFIVSASWKSLYASFYVFDEISSFRRSPNVPSLMCHVAIRSFYIRPQRVCQMFSCRWKIDSYNSERSFFQIFFNIYHL